MVNILIGCLGFIITHTFDLVALAGIRKFKPVVWFTGFGMIAYALYSLAVSGPFIRIAPPLFILGWVLLPIGLFLQLYPLFIDLPFFRTYVQPGVNNKLVVHSGFYALARHPGVIGFTLILPAVILISGSKWMIVAAPIFYAMDIMLVLIQDVYFFPKMFPDYKNYKKETPIFLPNKQSYTTFLESFKINKSREGNLMKSTYDLFKDQNTEAIWNKYCGFLDLSMQEFMNIQRRLLLEQLELLNHCELGNRIMNGARPRSVEEFRSRIPLTAYPDYLQLFTKRQSDILPEKPITWMHTSGRSGEYTKWVPVSERRYLEMGKICIASMIFSTCRKRGDVKINAYDRWLYALAPPPYMTGTWARCVVDEMPISILPDLGDAEKLTFTERTNEGIKLALEGGMDLFGGMPSVLLAVAAKFNESNGGNVDLSYLMKHPAAFLRLANGKIKAGLAGRKMLPKDLWHLKGILAGGAETYIYREKIKEAYGRYALDLYAFTEGGIIASQNWDYRDMTFFPSLNFYEFIPEEESIKLKDDPEYKPHTLLMNEVQPNQNYEIVITNLLGGPFVRYRNGDMIRITALRNEKLNIDIPQMTFYSRSDNVIDVAGFTRLTEKTIWQALENSEIGYKGWTARKESGDKLNIYIEPEDGSLDANEAANRIHECLNSLDPDYSCIEAILHIKPIKVTILEKGTFKKYSVSMQADGVKLGALKPPHINPPDDVIKTLIGQGQSVKELSYK